MSKRRIVALGATGAVALAIVVGVAANGTAGQDGNSVARALTSTSLLAEHGQGAMNGNHGGSGEQGMKGQGAQGHDDQSMTVAGPEVQGELTSDEIAGLVFSREEERLARDLYTLIYDTYGAQQFTNIASSEQKHFDAVGTLLASYGIEDPSAGSVPGVYEDPTLQALYDEWKAEAMTSLEAAFQVGVELEERDIADLQRLQEATSNADLDKVYAQLEQGSWRHLSAFSKGVNG